LLVFRNEDFDLLPQLDISAAGLIQKCPSRFGGLLQRGVEYFLSLPPKIFLHGQIRAPAVQARDSLMRGYM
jgi:hypothetical protein